MATALSAGALNQQIYSGLSVIADSESFLKRAARYITKLAAQKKAEDDTLMTKEEFFAKIDRSLAQAERGEVRRMEPNESIESFLRRGGYAI